MAFDSFDLGGMIQSIMGQGQQSQAPSYQPAANQLSVDPGWAGQVTAQPQSSPYSIDPGWSSAAPQPAQGPFQGTYSVAPPSFDWQALLQRVGQGGTLIGAGRSLYDMFRQSPTEKAQAQALKGMKNVSRQAIDASTNQAAIEQWKAEQIARARQELVKAGIPESSAMPGVLADIDRQALAMQQQGQLAALGLAQNSLAQQATAATAIDKERADEMANFAKLLELLGKQVTQP